MKEIIIIVLILTFSYFILSTVLKNMKDNYNRQGGEGGKEEEKDTDPTVIMGDKK